jgi:3-phenylpropionate/trans-cinnamate dioxygenase ferredoxin subunit
MVVVCPLADLAPGDVRRVEVEPPIAVFRTDEGELFAVDDMCTHQDASLADGWLEGSEIECPLHASKFDLRTGAVDAPPAKRPIRTHEVSVVDGVIHVRLSTAAPKLPPSAGVPSDVP